MTGIVSKDLELMEKLKAQKGKFDETKDKIRERMTVFK